MTENEAACIAGALKAISDRTWRGRKPGLDPSPARGKIRSETEWVVAIPQADGRIVIVEDDRIALYATWEDYSQGYNFRVPLNSIDLI